MVINIKIIPTLHGRVASRFGRTAADNERKRASVNFTLQVKIAKTILMKSRINSLSEFPIELFLN